MSKVAIYARVSSEDQAERGTIENQLEFARRYCDLHRLRGKGLIDGGAHRYRARTKYTP